jgi:glutathione peroxidase
MKAKFCLVTYIMISLPSIALASEQCDSLLNFESKRLHSSQMVDFCNSFYGKTLLVVNTASECGFTPQLGELESLYQKYKDQGLEIVGFPSNSFKQELADEKDTASVCYKNYGVSFTMVAPSAVIGIEQNAFFKVLTQRSGQQPRWNFNKYLINRNQESITYFPSSASPLHGELEAAIRQDIGSPL